MRTTQFLLAKFKILIVKMSIIISILDVILVTLIYVMIMLSEKWGPYDNLDNLPVAVVNNDLGAMSDGEEINVGNELMENLEGNKILGWDFVTTAEAEKGMDNMDYYMTIEVPEDFSANVVTVMDPNPVKPELKFTQNEGLHFMAAQVTDNAIETLDRKSTRM